MREAREALQKAHSLAASCVVCLTLATYSRIAFHFIQEPDSMFDQLFFRSDALTRQLSAPLVDERRQYLTQCAAQGMSRRTLRMKARLLL